MKTRATETQMLRLRKGERERRRESEKSNKSGERDKIKAEKRRQKNLRYTGMYEQTAKIERGRMSQLATNYVFQFFFLLRERVGTRH